MIFRRRRHARQACSFANLFAGRAAGAGQRRLEMGFRNRIPGLLPALSVLEVRFADGLPASTDPLLGRVDCDGRGIQLLLLDQKGPKTVVVSTPIATDHETANAPSRVAGRMAGSRSILD